jgi:hypothetical protein
MPCSLFRCCLLSRDLRLRNAQLFSAALIRALRKSSANPRALVDQRREADIAGRLSLDECCESQRTEVALLSGDLVFSISSTRIIRIRLRLGMT